MEISILQQHQIQITDKKRMYPITARGFMHPSVTKDLIQDVDNHVAESEFVMFVRPRKRIIAYLCFDLIHNQVLNLLHIKGLMVEPSYQGHGIGTLMVSLASRGCDHLGFHTANINMLRLGLRFGTYTDPIPFASTIGTSNPIKCISAKNLANDLYAEQGRYRGRLYGKELGNLLIEGLDEVAGDAVIAIIKIFPNLITHFRISRSKLIC